MESCWDSDPNKRPTFEHIVKDIKGMILKRAASFHGKYDTKVSTGSTLPRF